MNKGLSCKAAYMCVHKFSNIKNLILINTRTFFFGKMCFCFISKHFFQKKIFIKVFRFMTFFFLIYANIITVLTQSKYTQFGEERPNYQRTELGMDRLVGIGLAYGLDRLPTNQSSPRSLCNTNAVS